MSKSNPIQYPLVLTDSHGQKVIITKNLVDELANLQFCYGSTHSFQETHMDIEYVLRKYNPKNKGRLEIQESKEDLTIHLQFYDCIAGELFKPLDLIKQAQQTDYDDDDE